MNNAMDDSLLEAVVNGDCEEVLRLLDKGADPIRNTSKGKTCLGEAASIGNIFVLNLLIDTLISNRNYRKVLPNISSTRKLHLRSHKRKLKSYDQHGETVVKCISLNDRVVKDSVGSSKSVSLKQSLINSEKNQGYFVFIHSEGSSGDESRVPSTNSPSVVLTPSPQRDLEWDDEIGTFAPTTSEDETWSSLYEWYAAILERTGLALASASTVSSGLDQKDAFFKTALHYAAEQGNVGAVKLLCRAGCKVDITTSNGLTPLHLAVSNKHAGVVQALLARGSNINYRTHDKTTPLHIAASEGFLEMIKLLVSNDAALEARDSSDRTPLYVAATKGHSDVVRCLFVAGANVNCEDCLGYTPLCAAVWYKYTAVVEALLEVGARITHCHKLLHSAILQKQEEILEMLLFQRVGINLYNENGYTPLLLAVRTSQPKLVRILLEKGANVNAVSSITGATALHIAVEHPPEVFEELLKILLEFDIDLNVTAPTGDTALYRAIVVQKDDAAKLLIKYGTDVNEPDKEFRGLVNLTMAQQRRSPTLAKMLLKAGHAVSMPDAAAAVPPPGTTLHWLYHATRGPLALSDLCRIKIRSNFKHKNLYKCVSSLPLPTSVHRFIMMEDEE